MKKEQQKKDSESEPAKAKSEIANEEIIKKAEKQLFADDGVIPREPIPSPDTTIPLMCGDKPCPDYSTNPSAIVFEETIVEVFNIFNRKKLFELYNTNEEGFLNESQYQINELWKKTYQVTFHYATIHTEILILLGEILTTVDKYFHEKHAEDDPSGLYGNWVTSKFGIAQSRLLQHSRNLYKMGNFAKLFRCIGKNRLLELYRIYERTYNDKKEKKIKGEETASVAIMDELHSLDKYNELLVEFPIKNYNFIKDYEENIIDQQFKVLTDACVIKSRLKKVGITVKPIQAELMALYRRDSITVSEAKELGERFKKYGDGEKYEKALDDYIFNKMIFRDEHIKKNNPLSISKHLYSFINYIKDIQEKMKDPKFLKKQKRYTVGEKKLFIEAKQVINELVKDFGWEK